ncbi:MAG: acyl-CoA thioesterase [Bdellovibrionales bacterium]|nr:acyl-CoA thioesterase [Bdellovibrionales bacterium]
MKHEPAIRMVMMPRDTNHLGSIFGGHILSLIDQAAGYEARRNSPRKFVTKVMREVEFIAPVFVGDLVSFYTSTKRIGNTSVTVLVDVIALRGTDCLTEEKVTTAEVVMVAVDENRHPIAVKDA